MAEWRAMITARKLDRSDLSCDLESFSWKLLSTAKKMEAEPDDRNDCIPNGKEVTDMEIEC